MADRTGATGRPGPAGSRPRKRENTRFAYLILSAIVACSGLSGCDEMALQDEPPEPGPAARAVSVLVLRSSRPTRERQLTGTVEPWKQERIGFEVGGRVLRVREVGEQVGSPFTPREGLAEDGAPPAEDIADAYASRNARFGNYGTFEDPVIIAELDPEPYEKTVAQIEAQIDAVKAQARSLEIEIDEVLPRRLEAAQANRRLAARELERLRRLSRRDATSATALDEAEAAFQTREAEVKRIAAEISANQANLANFDAQLGELRARLDQAERDLENCTLRAPFPGSITDVLVNAGGYVQPGEPVVSLIVMDPIKVEAPVAARIERRIRENDRLLVSPPGREDRPQVGYVYTKDTAADPATRTYTITLLTRNERLSNLTASQRGSDIPTIPRIADVVRILPEPDSPLGVLNSALHRDGQGNPFVWRITNYDAIASDAEPPAPELRLEKVPVTLGRRAVDLLGLISGVELADPAGLTEGTPLACDVPEELADRQTATVLLEEVRWLLRPGDFVPVSLRDATGAEGFYVPVEAVVPAGETAQVYRVVERDDGMKRVEAVPVRAAESFGTWRRIEPIANDEATASLQDDDLIVVEGASEVVPGEPVRIVETREATP